MDVHGACATTTTLPPPHLPRVTAHLPHATTHLPRAAAFALGPHRKQQEARLDQLRAGTQHQGEAHSPAAGQHHVWTERLEGRGKEGSWYRM